MAINFPGSFKFTTNYSAMPPRNINPDTYAQNYANQNGISLDEAKAELKSKYGDPKAPDLSSGLFSQSEDSLVSTENLNGLTVEEQQLLKAGVPLEVIFDGDNAIKNFTDENGIDITPKENNSFGSTFGKLVNGARNLFAINRNNNKTQDTNELSPEAYDLYKAGVPLEVIQEGNNAIMKFLKDNNLV